MAKRKPFQSAMFLTLVAALTAAKGKRKLWAAIRDGLNAKYGIDLQTLDDVLQFVLDHLDDFATIFAFIMQIISTFTGKK